MPLLYDVSHNTCKVEEHRVDGGLKKLYVHRKGATRAFGPGHPSIPEPLRDVGQPVLIGGTMGTASYALAGTSKGMEIAFGSACHGAGRVMSRTQATKASQGRSIAKEMADKGVLVMASSKGTLREEMPEAYKNLQDVVQVVHDAGIATKVARLKSIACIKG